MIGPMVRAAGTVPWRRSPDGGIEVLIEHRPRFDDWSVPKGKLEDGESFDDAAVRETLEEVGASGELGPELCATAYMVAQGPKLVRYWLLEVTDEAFVANHEVDQVRWIPLPWAAGHLSYATDRAVMRSAVRHLS